MIDDELKKKLEEEEMKRQQHLQIQKFLKEEEKERKRTMASLKSHQRESKSRIQNFHFGDKVKIVLSLLIV